MFSLLFKQFTHFNVLCSLLQHWRRNTGGIRVCQTYSPRQQVIDTALPLGYGGIGPGKGCPPRLTCSCQSFFHPLLIILEVWNVYWRVHCNRSTNLIFCIKSFAQMVRLSTLCYSFSVVLFPECLQNLFSHIFNYDLTLVRHLDSHPLQLFILFLQEMV